MTPALDRDELAHAYHLRLLDTYPHDPEVSVRRAVQHADALLSALSPPAAVAPATPAPEGTPSNHPATNDYGQPVRVGASTGTTPAPEAKRPEWDIPEWVKWKPLKRSLSGPMNPYAPRRVLRREGDNLVVAMDGGAEGIRPACECEPCSPPVAGSAEKDEAFKALLAFAEVHEALWDSALADVTAIMLKHGWKHGESRNDFLISLRTKALALSRPAATKGGA